MLKNFKMDEFMSDFKLILFWTVYSFDKINDQDDTLNRLTIDCLDKHAPDTFDVIELQLKQNDLRYKVHQSQTTYDWNIFRQMRK